MAADPVACPECGAELEYDEVDVGVGTIKGNYHCDGCGWSPGQGRSVEEE